MNRLTNLRVNGIKTGYWSPAKKEELVQRLAAYEDTGLEPEEIKGMKSILTSKKPSEEGNDESDYYFCPTCNGILADHDWDDDVKRCGQKIDWGDQDER